LLICHNVTSARAVGLWHGGFYFVLDMSLHSSLKSASSLGAKRNVLKRQERVEILKKRKEWREGDRVFNLKKTKFVA
jgi:small basic protein (TIGR04137 family)